tara:strand:+ start:49 stop:867 length:819 start_codon:yes stop_codon:yes gene_type:complete
MAMTDDQLAHEQMMEAQANAADPNYHDPEAEDLEEDKHRVYYPSFSQGPIVDAISGYPLEGIVGSNHELKYYKVIDATGHVTSDGHKCRRGEWNPNPNMLFFSSPEAYYRFQERDSPARMDEDTPTDAERWHQQQGKMFPHGNTLDTMPSKPGIEAVRLAAHERRKEQLESARANDATLQAIRHEAKNWKETCEKDHNENFKYCLEHNKQKQKERKVIEGLQHDAQKRRNKAYRQRRNKKATKAAEAEALLVKQARRARRKVKYEANKAAKL